MSYLENQFDKEDLTREEHLKAASFRFLDVVISSGALVVFLPLLLLIAICVKATSKGPVLFRQIRYGQQQTMFTIYKFRTMEISEINVGFEQCVKNDKRITTVGKILRKLSLDELAQLFNVLRGDMSIVGPRPHAVAMDDEYIKTVPNYSKRFGAKPGITGLAQIKGLRGPTDTLEKIIKRIDADIEYIEKKSIAADLKIMFLTFPALIKPQNAF